MRIPAGLLVAWLVLALLAAGCCVCGTWGTVP